MFRDTIDGFVQNHMTPDFEKWEKEGKVDRAFFKAAAEYGFLGLTVGEQHGGMGLDDMYSLVLLEQMARHNMFGPALGICAHSYLAMNYLNHAANEDQKQRYLALSVTAEKIGCLAMTEPGAGSDLAALRTTAIKQGDHYIVNGSKTFITNGVYADYAVVAVKTDPNVGAAGVSLLIIDCNSEGYTTTKLNKLGIRSSDTAEIGLNNVKVPVENLLGEEGKGFYYMMESLQTERLSVAWLCVGSCLGVMDLTLEYIKSREAFGKPIAKIQVLRHKLAELQTEIDCTRALMYLATQRLAKGQNVVKEASMLKLKSAELFKTVTDECLQMFGGYGYMEEYKIARAYRDARVGTILAGSSEIMREIIAKMYIDGIEYNK
ncbi:unnamed protein product, partial [Notodromas monacha]